MPEARCSSLSILRCSAPTASNSLLVAGTGWWWRGQAAARFIDQNAFTQTDLLDTLTQMPQARVPGTLLVLMRQQPRVVNTHIPLPFARYLTCAQVAHAHIVLLSIESC